jgi:hypothetical protein
MDKDGCSGSAIDTFSLGSAVFTPGNYKAFLNVRFVPTERSGTQPIYRTTSEGKDIVVGAPLWAILIGAFTGGVVAYAIKAYYGVQTKLTSIVRPESFLGRHAWILEVLMSGLYGCTLVILSSRLPDTFPIKINANDLLGAVALGFVFQWIGVKLLEKLPGMTPPQRTAPEAVGGSGGPGAQVAAAAGD